MIPLHSPREWRIHDEVSGPFLARRARLVLRLILVGTLLFAVTDPWLHPAVLLELSAAKAAVGIVLIVGLRLLRRVSDARAIVAIGACCFLAAAAASAFSGVMTNDTYTTALLCVAGTLTTAAVIPWGARAQVLVALPAVSAVVANLELVAGATLRYTDVTGVAVVAAISVYVAYELHRQHTAQARAELALQRHQAEMAHALRRGALGEMAAQMSHELAQPLAAIANYAAGCRRHAQASTRPATEMVDVMNRIASEALRAGEIIHRLRGFVPKEEPRRAPANANDVVRNVALLVEGEARRNGVSLRLALDPHLPHVDVDATQIEHVVISLVQNAIESMAAGGSAERTLAIETRGDDEATIEVAVHDTGPGLDHGQAAAIFEPFHTTKPGGLGMGLAISRSIVEAHGGRLWTTPRRGGGATFRFTVQAGPV